MIRGGKRVECMDETVLEVLKNSDRPMTQLAVSYMINQDSDKMINMGVIKRSLESLMKEGKVEKKLDKSKNIMHYTISP